MKVRKNMYIPGIKADHIRSAVARSAFERNGAGTHGGTAKQKNRRDRKRAKLETRTNVESLDK